MARNGDQTGSGSPPSDAELDEARERVAGELEELGDSESAPSLPASMLAAIAGLRAPGGAARRRGEGPTGITREILRLGWPVMLSQVLVSTTGLVDRAMIGRLSGEGGSAVPLAAVGYATQYFFLIQSTLFAVGLACVALMARAIGAGNPGQAREALASSMQVAVAVTLAFTAIMLAAPEWSLEVLGAEPAVVAVCVPYLQLLVGSSILLATSLTFDSALRANRNTRTPMFVALVVAAVKIAANYALIFGEFGLPRLELVGAGLATVISQCVGLLIFVVIVARKPADSPVSFRWRRFFMPGPLTRQVVRLATPGILERVVLNLGLLSYFWVLSRHYGTLAVAAYSVGVPLLSFSWIPGSGYAQACATMVGQSLGAGAREEARMTGVRAATLAVITAIPLGLLFGFFRTPLAELFTADEAVVTALGPFMLALAIGQPFLQLHFTLGGAHRGAGDTWTPLVAATIGNWVFRVPLALLFAAVLEWDVVWVWYVLVFDHIARAAWLLVSFRRGRWMDRMD